MNNNYLKHCLYYHGEEECPYDIEDKRRGFWSTESYVCNESPECLNIQCKELRDTFEHSYPDLKYFKEDYPEEVKNIICLIFLELYQVDFSPEEAVKIVEQYGSNQPVKLHPLL